MEKLKINMEETVLEKCVREVYELNRQIEALQQIRDDKIDGFGCRSLFDERYRQYEIKLSQ